MPYVKTPLTRITPSDVHQDMTAAVVSFNIKGAYVADLLLFARGQDLTLEATLRPGTDSAQEIVSVVHLPKEYNLSACSAVLCAGKLTVTAPRISQKVRIIDVNFLA